MILDAEGAIAGKLSSYVAKQLLNGEKVIIVNAEKAIITGNPKTIMKEFLEKRQKGHPRYGPFYPKRPDLILRRMIRGMLPYKKPKGRNAYRRLKVYIGKPDSVKDAKKFSTKKVRTNYMTIFEISKRLGWSD